jgi:hypothetical protein
MDSSISDCRILRLRSASLETSGNPALADPLGRNLVAAWQKKALRPEVELQMNTFKERMKNLITYRREEWPFEYEYWRKLRGLKD